MKSVLAYILKDKPKEILIYGSSGVSHKLLPFFMEHWHKQRIKQFRNLKKSGDINQMKRKIEEWKKQGYNTLALDYKMKDLGKEDMQNILKKWKQEYTEGYKNKK